MAPVSSSRAPDQHRTGIPWWRQRTVWLALAVVFAVALALRLGHLASLRSSFEGTQLFSIARADAAHHWHEAQAILDGDFWLQDRMLYKGPGYSYFLAGLMQFCGREPANLRWPLAVLGALNCACLVLLARRLLPLGWAVATGLLVAVNGVLILHDGELYFPTLLIALNLPVFLLLTRSGAGMVSHLVAGLLMGLAVLVHPVYLLPGFCVGLGLLARGRLHAAVFVLAMVLAVLPTTLENVLVRKQPVLISWNGGINLYVGNHPAFDQRAGNGTTAWTRLLTAPADAGLEKEHEIDRFYYRLARQQALGHPLTTLGILLKKAALLLTPVEIASNFRLYELRSHSPILAATLGRAGPIWFPFGIWAPAALLGCCLLLRRPSPLVRLLGWWSLGLAVTIVVSWVTARYRAPIVFFGSIWVVYALREALLAWRRRQRRSLVLCCAAYLVLGVVVASLAIKQPVHPPPLEWSQVQYLNASGQPARAQRWLERMLRRYQEDYPLLFSAGWFYGTLGEHERARDLLYRLLAIPELEPDLIVQTRQELAKSYLAENRFDDARREYQAALAVGVDATNWRGVPYYQPGLGPVTGCHLKLSLADVELRAGNLAAARALVREVRVECGQSTGQLRNQLRKMEQGLRGQQPQRR